MMGFDFDTSKKRVVIIGGMSEDGFQPIPPVADGAPQWNVFRLVEAAASSGSSSLDIHVISPYEDSQRGSLDEYPIKAAGHYHHVDFTNRQAGIYRKYLQKSLPIKILLRRLVKLPDLASWMYLRRAVPMVRALEPDLVIINDRPQYIAYLRKKFPGIGLLFMMRHPIGESQRLLEFADGILVNSEGMRKYVEQLIMPGRPWIRKMPNAVSQDFNPEGPVSEGASSPEPVLLFAGRLLPIKGARELLLAFRQVHHQIPAAKLVICGSGGNSEGSTQYEGELRALGAQFPPGVVSFAGSVPNGQMYEYYQKASVAIFPSRPPWLESFGMVALEAMRCGVPVVASRQPGFEELVVPGETGLLVDDPCNEVALAGAILEILQDPEKARRMGQAGYERSLAYTPENGLAALEKIIHEYFNGKETVIRRHTA